MPTMPIHRSATDGSEDTVRWSQFRDDIREQATYQPGGDGGVKVIEDVTILSFDDTDDLVIVVRGVSYTIDPWKSLLTP
jgi:hypothetical protein